MKKDNRKICLKNILLFIVFIITIIPIIIIIGFVFFQIVGMAVNHYATDRQTEELISVVKETVADVDVWDSYSETGNTSGTGNHVDMLSVVVFQTKESEEEFKKNIEKNVENTISKVDEWGFYVESIEAIEKGKGENGWVPMYYDKLSLPEDKSGCYLVYLCNAAPFEDNIEGH